MKTIGQLIKSIAVNYNSMHDANRTCRTTEWGSAENTKAIERTDMYKEWLLSDIEKLKALGIDPGLLV